MTISSGSPLLSGTVLLLEDNAIIAMDGEDILLELGADKVVMASTVTQALDCLDTREISIAMLDIFIDEQTSAPVAEALTARKIPYIFASGEHRAREHSFVGDTPVTSKPFSQSAIARAIMALSDPAVIPINSLPLVS